MTHDIQNAPLGQPVCHVNDWLIVLKDAAQRDLIDPGKAAQIEVPFTIGLLTPDGVKARVLDALRAGPAAGLALDAIALAFAPGDVIELRALDPAGGGGLSICERLDDPNGHAALEAFIRDHIGMRNLYLGCNPRRSDMAGKTQSASAPDVPTRRSIVLDFDLKDAQPMDPDWTRTVDALQTELDPVLVLNSGNGFHVWLPSNPCPARTWPRPPRPSRRLWPVWARTTSRTHPGSSACPSPSICPTPPSGRGALL